MGQVLSTNKRYIYFQVVVKWMKGMKQGCREKERIRLVCEKKGKGGRTLRFQDTKNLVAGDETDLGNPVRITEGYTNL